MDKHTQTPGRTEFIKLLSILILSFNSSAGSGMPWRQTFPRKMR